MSIPKPDDSDYEDEATTARLDLLSAYTMHGRLERDGLVPSSVGATVEEAATCRRTARGRGRVLLQGAQREHLEGRVSQIETTEATALAGEVAAHPVR